MTSRGGYVEALLLEREGYVARGRMDRVAQVDAELARFGVAVDAPVERRAGGKPKRSTVETTEA